ncbi:hypothetical protein G9A89_001082 [Geosiphon pyriformis]|nr:hypothetical protein G9A89_001082 [Geosiphon pyriformis]
MNKIGIEKLFLVVGNLPNDKAARLSEILNKLWKHCGEEILVNKVITDFELLVNYRVHDELDQEEVFSLLLWRIFYDPLLCKVKRHDDKTVAISINQGIKDALLSINRLPISIAKKSELYQYLDIFLSTEGLSKPSMAQAHVDVSKVLHHPSLYGLKLFEQVQSEKKLAFLILFSNEHSILGHLFDHKFLDLQVLEWFFDVCDSLLKVWSDCIEVYIDGFLKCAGSAEMASGTAAYFLAADASIGIRVAGLLSSTLTEL